MQTIIEKICGRHYQVLVYPSSVPRGGRRGGRDNPTADYRQRLNDKKSAEKLAATLEANFGLDDLFVTLTYQTEPANYEKAKNAVTYFLKKYRAARKAAGCPYEYVYVIEGVHGDQRKHHHIVTRSDGDAAALIRRLWSHGRVDIETIRQFAEKPSARYPAISLSQCTREYGCDKICGWGAYCLQCFEKLALYITKEPRKTGRTWTGRRMYTPSMGLKQPVITKYELAPNIRFELPGNIALLYSFRTESAFGSFIYADGWVRN